MPIGWAVGFSVGVPAATSCAASEAQALRAAKRQPPTAVEAIRTTSSAGSPWPTSSVNSPRRRSPPARPRRHIRAAPTIHLLAIAPEVYVARLLGVEVPRRRKVRCPFHADRTASLHVYETAARGWYCFGHCRRGGTIYDLAAPPYGYGSRGEDFLRLRSELRRLFGLEATA